jgi:hypothetical protein
MVGRKKVETAYGRWSRSRSIYWKFIHDLRQDRREIFDKDINATAFCTASIGGVMFGIQIGQKLKTGFI